MKLYTTSEYMNNEISFETKKKINTLENETLNN